MMKSRDHLNKVDTTKESSVSVDGPSNSRGSMTLEDLSLVSADPAANHTTRFKKGKKRDKGKGPSTDHEHSHGKGPERVAPDRECRLM